jgi:SAM-dependent methyltransferase
MSGQGVSGQDVSAQGAQAAATWSDTDFARGWASGDSFRDMLDFPRRVAAGVIAQDNPNPATIIDIGAGPGAVIEIFLKQFPQAHGIWTDASRAMLDLAQENLAPFGDRVEYRIVDMTDLDSLPDNVDVLTTSRAVHHLDTEGLVSFYAAAARKLKPGGWLINLDHIGPASQGGPPAATGFDDVWDQRLRETRKQFGITSDGPKHHHNYPLTGIQDHMDAFAAAGITDVEVPWRAFFTCLFMGRKPE